MFGYVYITTNLINGRKYIGQHIDNGREDYLGSGVYFRRALKKYGRENFRKDILHWASTPEELDQLELRCILEADAVSSREYYNAIADKVPQGNRGNKNFRHSEESRQKIRLGVAAARQRIAEQGDSYLSALGAFEAKVKIQAHWTPERRAEHSAKIKAAHAVSSRARETAARYCEIQELLKSCSQREAADLLGVTQSAIANFIRDHEIKIEHDERYRSALHDKRTTSVRAAHAARRAESDKRWERFDLEAMYREMTQAEIARVVGVSQARVSQRLREKGLAKPKKG